MSNQAKKDQTQELIKETAKKLFFVKGKFDATTQEIADEAGVNRTLINYYFRSRDKLIQIIFDEAQKVEQEKSKIIQNADLPFKEKISQFIESSLSTSLQYPYLETYIVSQINKGTCHQREIEEDILQQMYNDIEKEMELGNIEKTSPVQFILNMVSLLVFPSAIRPLFMENLMISDEEYDKIISERKEIIINMLFKN
ncbi:TetR family transcriptional regulator [Chryseobacterium artocarpi]|uniref:Transcriptional regulator, TetR family n=2 Tax=Chryseobacterium TaxID=59732 RepID=A0A1N7KXS7_9FLAO|nr:MULTISPECIES: TetR/AcrR family transcriptional regulator [Chryseobacterium]OCA77531.1 TetR family transcriptional regulator [Chryseobacterium artocarpi]SIS66347.1 transcriptional regulator, TetR family [Chryseobacterium ureilyticum]